ncbi:MAG TPA: single-stranded-DNA-specific exonuclease RecJ, partial [Bryobacteraceae bacterium]|nr:single-stranded-DNA-specific exonuclease RecJ [Bryobacteraceae bacterium]
MRWLFPQIDPGQVRALSSALGLSTPVASVLVRRGYADPDAARRFLEPSLDGLHDPFLLKSMPEAAARLLEAIRLGEQVLLYGDYDVDGVTSVVILKKAIERAGGKVSYHVPNRLREGYGLRAEVIERAAASGVRLLISADTGVRAQAAVARASELGMDVIVTDHHLPDEGLPPAVAVLNPKRPDCPYPEKHLCGAGVAFKLVQALLQSLGWPEERRRRMLGSFLKLVAIGTVADVVPLTGENRILVKHGLEGLRSVRNPGLRALLDIAGFGEGDEPSARQVAFRIAPRMNAAGRMANAADVIDLFLTEDRDRARRLAAELHSLNEERQQAEAEIIRSILDECSRSPVGPSQKALVFSGLNWHRGVVGIVASRLVERFHRPAVVLGEDPETGLAQGSGRSIPAFHLLEALESMPDLFHQFGGHRQAVGVTLPIGRVGELRERLNARAAERLSDDDLSPVLELDAQVELADLTDEAVAETLSLAPFGCGNPPPVYALLDVEVAGAPAVLKDKHLRFAVRQGNATLPVIAWNFAGRFGELASGARVDLAFCCEQDTYASARGRAG